MPGLTDAQPENTMPSVTDWGIKIRTYHRYPGTIRTKPTNQRRTIRIGQKLGWHSICHCLSGDTVVWQPFYNRISHQHQKCHVRQDRSVISAQQQLCHHTSRKTSELRDESFFLLYDSRSSPITQLKLTSRNSCNYTIQSPQLWTHHVSVLSIRNAELPTKDHVS